MIRPLSLVHFPADVPGIRIFPFRDLSPDARAAVSALLEEGSEEGVAVVVAPGARIPDPVRISGGETGRTRVAVFAGAGAEVTVMEEIAGDAVRDHAAVVIAEDRARVTYASLHAPSARLSVRQRSRLGAEACVVWRTATLGPEVTHDVLARLEGPGARSDVDWMFYAAGGDRHALEVRNVFSARQGAGEILMRGVAEGKAHAACRGMIDIGAGGNGTDTYLTQDVLMLDPTAKVDAVPGLEIKTNDVKASHSATVARVTPEDLFYFASRGIAQAEARALYVHGFLGDIAARFPAEARESVLAAVEGKMAR